MASALYNKGVVLERLGRQPDALAVYRDGRSRFSPNDPGELGRLAALMQQRVDVLSVALRIRDAGLEPALGAVQRIVARLRRRR